MLFVFLLLISSALACELSGYSSGICVKLETVVSSMPFCGPWVGSQICVPRAQGLWPNNTVLERDKLVESYFMDQADQKVILELTSQSPAFITTNQNCFTSYKTFLCRWNFPNCIIYSNTTELTLPLCTGVCTGYQDDCGLSKELCSVNFQEAPGLDDVKCALTPSV